MNKSKPHSILHQWKRLSFLSFGLCLFLLPLHSMAALTLPIEEFDGISDHIRGLDSEGTALAYVRVPEYGPYTIHFTLRGTSLDGVGPLVSLHCDGVELYPQYISGHETISYSTELELTPHTHAIGISFHNDARSESEDRNLFLETFSMEAKDKARSNPIKVSTKQAWLDDAPAREQFVVQQTQTKIEQHRKQEIQLYLVNEQGEALSNTEVHLSLEQHAFLFGVNAFLLSQLKDPVLKATYSEKIARTFNYITAPLYWRTHEPERGQINDTGLRDLLAWSQVQQIKVKGHPILWNGPDGLPAWSAQPVPEILQRGRVVNLLQHYGDEITHWDVVNEPLGTPYPNYGQAYAWAASARPNARLCINDFAVLHDGHPDFFMALAKALEENIPFHSIGMQAHEPHAKAFPLDQVQLVLDAYATLGKKIQITEFFVPSGGEAVLGAPWRKSWTEVEQAKYAEAFYRVCFAHPAIEAISWWDMSDRGAWRDNAGLLRDDMSPKPVYATLTQLIHDEWQTRVSLRTDDSGKIRFSGFPGRYALYLQDKKLSRHITIEAGQTDNGRAIIKIAQ